ncbi:hypothetical protein FCH28_01235 [Streptomyces piniterrae]|uniref:Uncharacterized protein n=1 Tax=Streptomyces piniterrae TaxID=2571125 RepID=A0A4U0NVU7_9ACTN|nr:hypothetical protein [Streptomyces piniterrae]TJZ58813.1 hypothetical protein FCH28_01235 [Streptomyces piniterrae]
MSLYCEHPLVTPLDTALGTPPAERFFVPAYSTDLRLPPPRPEDRICPPPRPEDRIPFPAPASDAHRLSRPQSLTDPQGPQLQPPYRGDGDRPPAPPRPEDRLRYSVATPDRRRLDLQAALTKAGVAPAAGDAAAVRVLAALDDATVAAVIGWITAAAQGDA